MSAEVAQAVAGIERVAPAVVERVIGGFWREDPFWAARFGDRGRRYADEDSGHHLRYLAESLRSGDPTTFERYARWLRQLLVPRGMCTLHVVETFERIGAALADLVPEAAAPSRTVLAAGVAALAYEAGPAATLDEEARRSGDVLLSFLADAVAFEWPALFAAHVGWWSERAAPGDLPARLDQLEARVVAVLGGANLAAPALAAARERLAQGVG